MKGVACIFIDGPLFAQVKILPAKHARRELRVPVARPPQFGKTRCPECRGQGEYGPGVVLSDGNTWPCRQCSGTGEVDAGSGEVEVDLTRQEPFLVETYRRIGRVVYASMDLLAMSSNDELHRRVLELQREVDQAPGRRVDDPTGGGVGRRTP